MITVTVYTPKRHYAFHGADRDVIAHALETEQFVSVNTDNHWTFYVRGQSITKQEFCLLVGKQIADNGSEWTTVDNSEWTLGYRAVAVGCQYYRNTRYKIDADNAGALLAFIANNTDNKGQGNVMKNFEMLKKLMAKAREEQFLTPDQLPEGTYEATLTNVVENDKRTLCVFQLSNGSVAMSFGNDDTGLSFLAQMLVKLGVSPDNPSLDGLKGTGVVLKVTHSADGEFIRSRIVAVTGKDGKAVNKPGTSAPAQAEEEVVSAAGEEVFDPSTLSVGDNVRVQFGEEEKEGELTAIDGDDFVVSIDGTEYAFTPDMILGLVVADTPPPAPARAPARGKAPAAGKAAVSSKAPAARKPAVSKKAAPKMNHGVGDNVVVEIEGKKYRTVIKSIEDGQYVAAVKGEDYLLTDEHIVG